MELNQFGAEYSFTPLVKDNLIFTSKPDNKIVKPKIIERA